MKALSNKLSVSFIEGCGKVERPWRPYTKTLLSSSVPEIIKGSKKGVSKGDRSHFMSMHPIMAKQRPCKGNEGHTLKLVKIYPAHAFN